MQIQFILERKAGQETRANKISVLGKDFRKFTFADLPLLQTMLAIRQ